MKKEKDKKQENEWEEEESKATKKDKGDGKVNKKGSIHYFIDLIRKWWPILHVIILNKNTRLLNFENIFRLLQQLSSVSK